MTTPTATRLQDLSPRWLALLLIIRVATAATAVALLAAHHVSAHDRTLVIVVVAYTALSSAAVRWSPAIVQRPAAWVVDISVVLALVIASGDWRSPFYLLALTTLATPAAALRPSRAFAFGLAATAVYAVVAHIIGPDPLGLGAQTTIETLATHLVLPVLVAFGISYAAEAMRGLRNERRRAERLAIEAERRRIAWDLHDSAKQRVHAAHLVLDSLPLPDGPDAARAILQVLRELRAAATDMDTSVAELTSPLEGRPLEIALRERAAELSLGAKPVVRVRGRLPVLEPLQAAHAYRIAAEAMTNAVRHAQATEVDVVLAAHGGDAVIVVVDDGKGLPAQMRPGANGLRGMRHRAATIGGELEIGPRPDGDGTRVHLRFPIHTRQEVAA